LSEEFGGTKRRQEDGEDDFADIPDELGEFQRRKEAAYEPVNGMVDVY
jgi:hypothetical protein